MRGLERLRSAGRIRRWRMRKLFDALSALAAVLSVISGVPLAYIQFTASHYQTPEFSQPVQTRWGLRYVTPDTMAEWKWASLLFDGACPSLFVFSALRL